VGHGDRSNAEACDLDAHLGLKDLYWMSAPSSRECREIRPDEPVEEVPFQDVERGSGPGDEQRLAAVLRAVVGDGREIADVIEMRVAHEHRLEAGTAA